MSQLRANVKIALDAAIQAGSQPSVPRRSGMGLVLKTPSGRFRTLVDKNGITPAGRYYYEKTGIPAPSVGRGGFNHQQDAVRKGRSRSQYIKLLDGSQKKVSTWDSLKREWKLTELGKNSLQTPQTAM